MKQNLFLGIADSNCFASAVVGDSSGRILATDIGGSINYHALGIEQARTNLQRIIAQTVGWDKRKSLAGACFTYQTISSDADCKMPCLVHGLLSRNQVHVACFAASSTLGIRSTKDRLLLVGAHTGLAIFKSESGLCRQLQHNEIAWNLKIRLNQKLEFFGKLGVTEELENLLYMKAQSRNGECLPTLAGLLDELVDMGNSLALELAYDLAYDLFRLVTNLSSVFGTPELAIGLYGSVLLGSSTVRERVCYLINLLFPYSQISEAPFAPAEGAYLSSVLTRRSDGEQEEIINLSLR